jgi:pimeloyl-ACP methyl ester carboxylesterase
MLPYNKNIFEPGTRIAKDDMRSREGIRHHITEFFYRKEMVNDAVIDNALKLGAIWHDRYMKRDREIWGKGQLEGLKQRQRQYSINGAHISESVHLLKPRTLIVWGKQSNKGVDGGVALFKKIPDAQMHIFDKANHFVWMDQPKEFNSLVSWYLREG